MVAVNQKTKEQKKKKERKKRNSKKERQKTTTSSITLMHYKKYIFSWKKICVVKYFEEKSFLFITLHFFPPKSFNNVKVTSVCVWNM